MSQTVCRWGILGTANIARKNWHALLNAENSQLVAVASRSLARSQQFIDECQSQYPHPVAPVAVGTYEELLQRSDIDAVYIPLPTGLRKEWVIKAAAAGKHVLCEKPCATSLADLEDMVAACQKHGVQFMDGVMFMHSARLNALRKTLDDQTSVGALRRIQSGFSFLAPDDFLQGNIRVQSGLEPAGCLGDLGWYNIRLTLWIMNYERPQSVTGRLLSEIRSSDSTQATPTEFSGELLFKNGVSAGFYCSFLTEQQEWAHISGTKGHLTVSDFVLPFYGPEVAFEVSNNQFAQTGCEFNMERHSRTVSVREYASNHPTAQETNLFRNFAALVLDGQRDPHWSEIAVLTQAVMEACWASARNGGAPVTL